MSYAESLTALDSVFLAIEDEQNLMHVGLTGVFRLGPLAGPEGGLDMPRVRRYAESILGNLPRQWRQRVTRVPLLRHRVWVDDAHFDLDQHVRYVALPPPGDDEQLRDLVGRLYSEPLSRERPLWENWFIDGLAGDRFAVVMKAHHSMVDGVSGIAVLAAMLRADPDARVPEVQPWTPEPPPTPGALLLAELSRRVREPRALLKTLGERMSGVDFASLWRDASQGLGSMLGTALHPSTRTSINPRHVGWERRFDWVAFDLDSVRAVKQRANAKLNDVVLALVSGALRRFLLERGDAIEDLDFRAMVPVSTHEADEQTLHNHVSLMLTPLPIAEPSAARRLERIKQTMGRAKTDHQSTAVTLGEQLADLTNAGILGIAIRMLIRMRPFNIIVTNIPGPQFPLYLLGAELLEAVPMVPLYENQGVGIAIVSYNGKLFFGLNADAADVKDLSTLARNLRTEMDELATAFHVAPAPSASPG